MANKTTNYGLTKPLSSEFYDVEVQNSNMDIIDSKLKELDPTSASTKTTLVDADTIHLNDSAASNKQKKITWANIKTLLANAFAAKSHASTHKTGGSDAINASDIGAVPTSRTINGKALTDNISLNAEDVGLDTANDQTVTFTRAAALQNLTSGAKLSTLFGQLDVLNYRFLNHVLVDNPHEITPAKIKAVPTTRKINGKALSEDITLYTYSTTDLTAGSSSLETGKLYFVYE